MKKIIMFIAAVIMLAGCATLAPEKKADWSGVNSADLAALQNGQLALDTAVAAEAAGDALKAQGFELEKTGADALALTTVRKHGVTFYGSCDYALSCKVASENGAAKLSWYTISYVTQFMTKTDPLDKEASDKWNIAVYDRLVEKGKITRNIKSEAKIVPVEEKAAEPAATATPSAIDKELPPPPKEE